MKCFNHNDRDAVVSCNQCSKGLCQDCVIRIGDNNYCPQCFKTILNYQKKLVSSLRWRLIFFGLLFVFGIFCGIVNHKEFFANWYICVVIGTLPIAFYYMKGTPDPYVPTSLESAGGLMLLHLAIACLLGPFFAVKGFLNYRALVSTVENNTKVYEEVLQSSLTN